MYLGTYNADTVYFRPQSHLILLQAFHKITCPDTQPGTVPMYASYCIRYIYIYVLFCSLSCLNITIKWAFSRGLLLQYSYTLVNVSHAENQNLYITETLNDNGNPFHICPFAYIAISITDEQWYKWQLGEYRNYCHTGTVVIYHVFPQ